MDRNLYKSGKRFIHHHLVDFTALSNGTAKKVEGFRGVFLNISETVQMIFMPLSGRHL